MGSTIAEQLSKEQHNITVIDTKQDTVERLANTIDIMGIVGNGAVYSTQLDAGVAEADLLIAVTGQDELNLLCCLIARKAGGCRTIARVSNPVYYKEISFLKEELGLSLVINPEFATAAEIARLLKYPSALEIDSFAKGRSELVKYHVPDGAILCDMKLRELPAKFKNPPLICVVQRGDEITIPNGDFTIRAGDDITFVSPTSAVIGFFRKLKAPVTAAHDAMIVGGGGTSLYLAQTLLNMGLDVKIIERDKNRCNELCELIPGATIICGDGTDRDVLMEEGLAQAGAFISMTEIDEENIMLSLFAKRFNSHAKYITRIHRLAYDEILCNMDLGSVVYPRNITAEFIITFVRAMRNSLGSNIEALYRICDDKVEALEFLISADCRLCGIPLKDLKLKKGVLIASIFHNGAVQAPSGASVILAGDTVVVVTMLGGLDSIEDILE